MLKTLKRKAHRLAKATRKPQICCLFTLEQPSAVKTESPSELAKFFKENLQIQAKQKPYRCSDECYPLTDSHQGANHLIQAPKGLWRKRCLKSSQKHNSLHRQAHLSNLRRDQPKRTRKAENLPHYKTSIPHSSRISGHYTTRSMSTERVIADDCYCTRCQNALSNSDSSKVESPSPIASHRVSDRLGESVLVL